MLVNKYIYRNSVPNVSLVWVFFWCISLLSRLLTCFISNIQIAINGFIFTFIFYIFPCYNELDSCIFYCAGGSNEDSSESSPEDSEEDEFSSDEDDLAHIEKKHQKISKDIKDIDHELSEINKAKKLAKKLPESAKNLNRHENFIKNKYPNWRREELKEYLLDERKRLRVDKKEYESKILQAKESIGDTQESSSDTQESIGDTKVDSLMGNKRKESPIEDTNPNSTKRKKSSNNDDDDDSSGSSGPTSDSSGSSGPTSDSSDSSDYSDSFGLLQIQMY